MARLRYVHLCDDIDDAKTYHYIRRVYFSYCELARYLPKYYTSKFNMICVHTYVWVYGFTNNETRLTLVIVED